MAVIEPMTLYFFDLDDLNIPDTSYYARSVLHDTSGYDTVKFIGGEYLGSGVVFNYDPEATLGGRSV